jgi:nucleoside-diphosphate-sugar epimerase
MQTILGAGGAVGKLLAAELIKYTSEVRLVARNPQKVNPTDTLLLADLTDPDAIDRAIAGSKIVYVTIGFEYHYKTWAKLWPPFMKSVIQSCCKHNCKLVFFDNMYMYDPDFLDGMDEQTPIRPVSAKGKVRVELAQMVMDAIETKEITAMIVRAADFLGTHNSAVYEMIVANLKKGKAANLLASADKVHNYTWVPDAAKATALLGNTPEAYNQVWHLPSLHERLTGREWVELFAKEIGVKPRYSVLPVWMMGIVGVFVPILKELKEMIYQYERDYYFDSSKFEKHFGFKPITAKEAVKQLLATAIE